MLDVINPCPSLGTTRAPAPNPGQRAGVRLEDLGGRHYQISLEPLIDDEIGQSQVLCRREELDPLLEAVYSGTALLQGQTGAKLVPDEADN